MLSIPMAQVLIRNLDDDVVATLKQLAEAEKVSLEQKLRTILSDAARKSVGGFWTVADEMRLATAGAKLDSTDLIRQARDER